MKTLFTIIITSLIAIPAQAKCGKVLALVANNDHKPALLDFAKKNLSILKKVKIIGTGATAKQLSEELKLETEKVNHGPDGGDIDIAYGMLHQKIHGLFFYIDAGREQPHDEDIGMLFRQSTRLNVPFAPNPATGHYLLKGLEQGGFFSDTPIPAEILSKKYSPNVKPVVVLSANDSLKNALLEVVRNNPEFFKNATLLGTGNTARLLEKELGYKVEVLPDGRQGGNLALQQRIEAGKVDAVFSFRDVSSLSGYDDQTRDMIRTTLIKDIPFAANPITAKYLLLGMQSEGFQGRK